MVRTTRKQLRPGTLPGLIEQSPALQQQASMPDPAQTIGLAMAFARQGGIAAVPDVLLTPLVAATLDECGASKAALAWLEQRPKTAASSSKGKVDAKVEEADHE
jgi:hypothetical protein